MQNEIIHNILSIPERFKRANNISVNDLLKETGYFQKYESVTEENIKEILLVNYEYIDVWSSYSEDKRSESGYYFKYDNNNYVVGYLDKSGKVSEKRYSEKVDACASFIKSEIEEIRKLS